MDQLVWRKSRRSDAEKACVEVAAAPQSIAVRDSKNPGPMLMLSRNQGRGLLADIKAGAHDL